jgi:hypothetical protein
MANSAKKVIVRTLAQAVHAGYLPASGFVAEGKVPLLDLTGRVTAIPLAGVRYIAFVRDFNLDDAADPERLTRRAFLGRPRTEGLWVRIAFAAGDTLEGLAPLDAGLLDGLVEDGGLFLVPPDIRSNTQRLFVPRSAIAELQVLGVVTTPSKTRPAVPESRQDTLFPEARRS